MKRLFYSENTPSFIKIRKIETTLKYKDFFTLNSIGLNLLQNCSVKIFTSKRKILHHGLSIYNSKNSFGTIKEKVITTRLSIRSNYMYITLLLPVFFIFSRKCFLRLHVTQSFAIAICLFFFFLSFSFWSLFLEGLTKVNFVFFFYFCFRHV